MTAFERRLADRKDELEWLYLMELYDDRARLNELGQAMLDAWAARSMGLRQLDGFREQNPDWFLSGNMLGMTMYAGLFAGNLSGMGKKLDYLSAQGITYLHLMPLLKMPHLDHDGGYAVEDFGLADPALGTNTDLERLTAAMRKRGMSLCLGFVLNHTVGTHEWAVRAKAGEREYIDRYICWVSGGI